VTLVFLTGTTFAQARKSSTPGIGDHVTVRPGRVVILRRGQVVKDFPEKRRATVTYPIVSGLKDLRVLRRVQSILDVKNAFDTSIAEYRQDNWLEEFTYKVNYNKNHVLDITFTQDGSGAYPDTHTRHFAINLKNGSVIKAADVFMEKKLPELSRILNDKLQAELKEILESLVSSKSDPEDVAIAKETQEPLRYTIENLNEFSVGPKGITFLYDAGYPHAIQAFELNGKYFFSYAELKSFIRRDRLLGQFID
jgi:hypothetical protein